MAHFAADRDEKLGECPAMAGTIERLREFLGEREWAARALDTSAWGRGSAKPLGALWHELQHRQSREQRSLGSNQAVQTDEMSHVALLAFEHSAALESKEVAHASALLMHEEELRLKDIEHAAELQRMKQAHAVVEAEGEHI